MEMVLTQEK